MDFLKEQQEQQGNQDCSLVSYYYNFNASIICCNCYCRLTHVDMVTNFLFSKLLFFAQKTAVQSHNTLFCFAVSL